MRKGKGKQKPNLRDLSNISLTSEEERELAKAAGHPNPTVTAIMAAVLVEHELEGLLRRRFRKDGDTWLDLTGDNGPLGTFDKKIKTAHALGICDDITRKNLNIIRNIRNAFAHSKKLIDFNHELIVEELNKISFRNEIARKKFDRLIKSQQHRYQQLCFIITFQLMRKHTKAIRSGTQRLSKRTSNNYPYANALMGFLNPFQPKIAGFGTPSFPNQQSADPSGVSALGPLVGLLATEAKKQKDK
jgi:DNA-binding MltR family transcriptional regulator